MFKPQGHMTKDITGFKLTNQQPQTWIIDLFHLFVNT